MGPTDPNTITTSQETKYVFCSEDCEKHFEANLDQYVGVTDGVVELS